MRRWLQMIGVAATLLVSMSASAQDQFFDSSGVRLRYVERGAGQPIVLIHGLGGAVEYWSEFGVIEALAKRYHVIAFDSRGHGKSDKPHDPAQYGAEMALDVVRLLDHLHLQQAHIVGYSMGGAITSQLLTLHPERVLTAVIGGAAGRFEWTDADARDAEQAAARSMADPKSDQQALAALVRAQPQQVIDPRKAGAVTVPTIGIVGGDDPRIAQFHALKSVRPSLRLIVLDGATHSGSKGVRGRPEFLAAVTELIDSHSTSASTSRDNPFVGMWKMNPLKSTFDPGPPYQSATVTIEPAEGGHKVVTERVDAHGQTVRQVAMEVLDGKEHVVTGPGAPKTRSYRLVDDHTLEYVQKENGKVTTIGRNTVSADGQTLTARPTGTDPQGRRDVIVYEKQ